MKKIIIEIKTNGEIVVQTKGYSGSECVSASKLIEEFLGDAQDIKFTQEFYEQEVGVELVSQGK